MEGKLPSSNRRKKCMPQCCRYVAVFRLFLENSELCCMPCLVAHPTTPLLYKNYFKLHFFY